MNLSPFPYDPDLADAELAPGDPLFRQALCAKIDRKVNRDAAGGIEYPQGSGKLYSCTVCSQINTNRQYWRNAGMDYPWLIATLDNSEIVEIADANEMEAFSDANAAQLEVWLQSSRAAKRDVLAAQSDEDALTVFDAHMGD